MTKLSYVITHNGKEIPSMIYTTWGEAKAKVAELGRGYNYKAVFTPFNPEETPEKVESLLKHARKLAEKRKAKNDPSI